MLFPKFKNRNSYNVTKQKKKPPEDSVKPVSGFIGLFRYASKMDVTLMALGMVFSLTQGAAQPALGLIFGHMTNVFLRVTYEGLTENGVLVVPPFISASQTNSSSMETEEPMTTDEFNSVMANYSYYYAIVASSTFITSYLQFFFWEWACERQVYSLRRIFFSQVLRQDVTWFDSNEDGDLSSKLADDLERIREGIGHKCSMVAMYLSTFVSGLTVGLCVDWRLTVVLLAATPILLAGSAIVGASTAGGAKREQLKYSIASGIADEVLSSLRTVAAFGGEQTEIERYGEALNEGRLLAFKKYLKVSSAAFFVLFTMYASYGLAFWYGADLVSQHLSTPGQVFTVFFSVMVGAFSVGNVIPFVNTVSTAIGAASTIFNVIDRQPNIDPYSDKGIKKPLEGNIKFSNVQFTYPTRKKVPILRGLNIDIEKGQKVALIGSSGAGKSTIISLILRYYDVSEGTVLIDGTDVKDYNLRWLRSNIGLVSQEPILFGVSIAENISYGHDNVTMEDIVRAAKLANADSFIRELPEGYDTPVGERGAQLSGGQKQRVAIARAVVRNPKILLLDEATSALDSQSEGIVQAALDNAMEGRTTVIIAHRLSTIRNADLIYAMKDGVVFESGNHKELMAKHGLYYDLVMIQQKQARETELMEQCGNVATMKEYTTEVSVSLSQNLKENELEESGILACIWRLIKFNSEEWYLLVIGAIACTFIGMVSPVFALFFGQFFTTFSLPGEEMFAGAKFWSLMFVTLGIVSGLAYWIQILAVTTAAEKLVARLRFLAFANIVKQELSWFDDKEHSVGKLTTKLSRDPPLVKAASGLRGGQIISAVVTLSCAFAIAIIYGWKLALMLSLAVPIIIYASYKQISQIRNAHLRDMSSMEAAGRISSEGIANLKTVQALGKEKLFLEKYMNFLEEPYRNSTKQAALFALTFAISQGIIYFMYASAFRIGAYLIAHNEIQPNNVYRVFFALAFCASATGQGAAYLQDLSKGKLAAKETFRLIDKKSKIDPTSNHGSKPTITGSVAFENVHFKYPSRGDQPILRGLTVKVEAGKTLALVGGSGCGKSTAIALLERYYDPSNGKILVDGININNINLAHLRRHIGLVTQEPTLFNCSIRRNIAYGALYEEVSDQRIIDASKKANIHDFILSLPKGYETLCGEKGTQLSGGQKQRIAIARALVRDPKILLLDEATSALDTQSEKVVQDALDKARLSRTCIIIAHRLSTIKNADQIAVIQNGRVIEIGTHDELTALRGLYYELVKRQNL